MDSLITSYKEKGFCILKNFISEQDVSLCLKQIYNVFTTRMNALGFEYQIAKDGVLDFSTLLNFFKAYPDAYIACMLQIQNLLMCFELGTSHKIISILKQLGLTVPIFANKPIVMLMNKKTSKAERYWKMPAHQDWRSMQGSLNGIVLWCALEETHDVGPIEVVPGSHKLGLLPSVADEWFRKIPFDGEVSESDFVPVLLQRGDAVLFSAFLVHRSGFNDSERHRCSIQFRYNDLEDETFNARNFPTPYVSDVADKNTIVDGYQPQLNDILKVF